MNKFDSKIYERDIYEDSVYSAWLKHSNERDVFEKYLKTNLGKCCKKDSLSILELGCGSGSAARRMLSVLNEKGITYSYTGVDPYQDQLDRWLEISPLDKNVTLIKGTVENFVPNKKYDLVLVVHSLYYVDNLAETLKKICTYGTNSFIVHHGEKGINEIHQAFRSYVKPGNNIISTYNNVKIELDNLHVPYNLDIVMTKTDIRPCHDPKNEDGRKLIKFFLERSELSENIIEEVSSFLREKGDFLKQDVGYFTI